MAKDFFKGVSAGFREFQESYLPLAKLRLMREREKRAGEEQASVEAVRQGQIRAQEQQAEMAAGEREKRQNYATNVWIPYLQSITPEGDTIPWAELGVDEIERSYYFEKKSRLKGTPSTKIVFSLGGEGTLIEKLEKTRHLSEPDEFGKRHWVYSEGWRTYIESQGIDVNHKIFPVDADIKKIKKEVKVGDIVIENYKEVKAVTLKGIKMVKEAKTTKELLTAFINNANFRTFWEQNMSRSEFGKWFDATARSQNWGITYKDVMGTDFGKDATPRTKPAGEITEGIRKWSEIETELRNAGATDTDIAQARREYSKAKSGK